jgi:hypothetical protein
MCLIESRAGWRKEGIGKGEDGAVSGSTEEAEHDEAYKHGDGQGCAEQRDGQPIPSEGFNERRSSVPGTELLEK